MCRDVCKLVTDQVKLLRKTRQSIVGEKADEWTQMPFAAKDRALAAELKTERSLHAALWPHDQQACRGHYAVSVCSVWHMYSSSGTGFSQMIAVRGMGGSISCCMQHLYSRVAVLGAAVHG